MSKERGLSRLGIGEIMRRAFDRKVIIPAFNIAHLPMLRPVADVLRELNSFGLIAVARPDWEKFQARSISHVREEYSKYGDPEYMRLHLDHTPVIDEDGERVDWEPIIREALELGYDSVMIDGSRLPLEENIEATRRVVEMSHPRGVPVEAELGAVLGHEKGPLPPYEELFRTGKGFTSPEEAKRFVEETCVDWLSVAVGNIHGAISGVAKDKKKPEARLSIPHLKELRRVTNVPLVLHGGSNIKRESVLEGVRNGISKINIGTNVRQAYERGGSPSAGQEEVRREVAHLIKEYFEIEGSHDILLRSA
ncbi:MAG: class II fructose-bisphosphate aldolase [bacterium]